MKKMKFKRPLRKYAIEALERMCYEAFFSSVVKEEQK
jgi:hypothetical protein